MRFYKAAVLAFFTLLVFAQSSVAGGNTSVVLSIHPGLNDVVSPNYSSDATQVINIYSSFLQDAEEGTDVLKKTLVSKRRSIKEFFHRVVRFVRLPASWILLATTFTLKNHTANLISFRICIVFYSVSLPSNNIRDFSC